MKSEAEFNQLYDSQLVPQLVSLEQPRREAVRSFWVAVLWVFLAIPALLLAFRIGNPVTFILPAIPLIISFLKFSDHGKKKNVYIIEFKKKVIEAMIKMLSPDLSYAPQSMISMGEYTESAIFRQSIDSYSGDDLVNGKLGNTSLKFSELHHQERQVSYDAKGNRRESW